MTLAMAIEKRIGSEIAHVLAIMEHVRDCPDGLSNAIRPVTNHAQLVSKCLEVL